MKLQHCSSFPHNYNPSANLSFIDQPLNNFYLEVIKDKNMAITERNSGCWKKMKILLDNYPIEFD